jgi:hypothetical protein
MAKKKSSRAKTGAKKKTVKDLAPKNSARGGLTQTVQVARLNPSLSGNTVGSSLGIDSLRSL